MQATRSTKTWISRITEMGRFDEILLEIKKEMSELVGDREEF